MDGISRTCLGCQAELGPNARFCPRCGQPASIGSPEPGDPVPGSLPPGRPDGPGFTVAARPQPAPYPPAAPSYPPPGYQRPPYGQALQDQQGFEPFRGYPPGAGPPAPGPPPGPPRQPPRRHDGNGSGTSLALWLILLVILLGGGVAAAVAITHPFRHPGPSESAGSGTGPAASASAAASGAASPPVSPTASASAPAVTEQQAAASVASMLSQSVSDRAAIVSASSDVASCGPDLASDPKVFDDAASSRQSLLATLTGMPGRAALPPALVSDLTNAWQASIAADQAYAKWANDEISQGCVPNDTSDPGYLATETPNANATKYKTAFVAQWNPIAAQYGLTQYQQGQL